MIEVKNLTKKYGSKVAVNDISFHVKPGEILGFLGPNGAGKSTTMNIITGYIASTEGTVTVDGHEIFEDPIAVKAQIGYLPEQPPLYLDMTVEEYLKFMFNLKKVKLPRKAHLEEVSGLVGITHVFDRIIANLSKGYRQRVGLAQALLGNPKVLILDEPTVGLDPHQIIEIRNLIKGLGDKHTIILSSHILPEVQAICERVIVISDGVILADDTPDNLSRAMSTDHKLIARIEGPEAELLRMLNTLPHVLKVAPLGVREKTSFEFSIETSPGTDVRRDLFTRLSDRNWPLLGLKTSELSLEDIFLELTSKGAKSIKREEVLLLDEEDTPAEGIEEKPHNHKSDEGTKELATDTSEETVPLGAKVDPEKNTKEDDASDEKKPSKKKETSQNKPTSKKNNKSGGGKQ